MAGELREHPNFTDPPHPPPKTAPDQIRPRTRPSVDVFLRNVEAL